MTVSVMFLTTATHFSAVYWVAATRVQLDLKHEKTDRRTAQKKNVKKSNACETAASSRQFSQRAVKVHLRRVKNKHGNPSECLHIAKK